MGKVFNLRKRTDENNRNHWVPRRAGSDAPAGTYLGVGDGCYASLKLRKGQHTVRIQSGKSSFPFFANWSG